MAAARDCLVMAKPAGPRCNLSCSYCYYLAKAQELPRGPGRLPKDLLAKYIRERLESAPGRYVHFEWHGGEPTLLGVEYFRDIVRLQRQHCPDGKQATNGLQTNGTLINAAWADFLAAEGFSVGLSMDGPADIHDAWRVEGGSGAGSHARAERAFRRLAERRVFTNVLCVVSCANAGQPDDVYEYFRGLGVKYLQFLPLSAGREAAPPEQFGAFLCRVFDLWMAADVGRVVVQTFDEALRPAHGLPHSLCIHRETCGDVAVLEHDGGFYACDHFVDEAHLLGSLRERSIAELSSDPRLLAFGEAKRSTLPQVCRECDVLAWCNGGCPKDRGPDGVNRLCAGWKAFFQHAKPGLAELSAHMKAGRRLTEFQWPVIAEQGKTGTAAPPGGTIPNGTGNDT